MNSIVVALLCCVVVCDGRAALRTSSRAKTLAAASDEASQSLQHWHESPSFIAYPNAPVITSALVVSAGTVLVLAALVISCLWGDVSRESKHFATPIKASDEDLALPGPTATASSSKERPPTLTGDCIGALMAFVVELVNCITIGLILKGNWPKEYLDVLFRHAAYGFLVTQLVTTMISQFPVQLSTVGFECLSVMLVVRKIVVDKMGDQPVEAQVMTFMACSTITTFISALLLGLMVIPQFSRILNMFPNSLRIGVFAATGIGIFLLGFQAFQLEPTSWASWTEWQNVVKWLPAFVIGMILWFLDQYYWTKWLFLIFVVVVVAGVHLFLANQGWSLEHAADEGWLLGKVPGNTIDAYYRFLFGGIDSVNWSVVISCADRLFTAAFIGPLLNVAINILLMESLYKTNCNYSKEFLAQSLGNVAAGLLCGWNSYLAVGDTNTLRQAGGKTSRSIAILCSMILLVCVVPPLLPAITSFVPTLLIASICVYGGFWMAKGSLIDNYFCFSPQEYTLVILTVIFCICFTILEGLKLGFAIMTFLYMVRGASDDYLRYLLSLRECRSVRSYAPIEETWLQRRGGDVVVAAIDIQLISVFSDPAHIWRQIQTRVATTSAVGLLVDFAGVQRLDATSIQTFVKMLTNIQPCSIVLANIPNSDLNEHGVLRRNLEEQSVQATLFLEKDVNQDERSKDALVFAEQLLISKMPIRRKSMMPLLGLMNLNISAWPVKARIMAKLRVLHGVLQLYLSHLDQRTADTTLTTPFTSSRSLYHFALRGRCTFRRLERGETLLHEGDHLEAIYVLACGIICAREAGDNVAEHTVMGELIGVSALFASSPTELVATSRALVMHVDLRNLFDEANVCPDALLVLQYVLQEVARSQEAKMARRIRLLTHHATRSN